MKYDFNVSDIIATAITRHNAGFHDFIDEVKKTIRFSQYDESLGIPCPADVTPDTYSPYYSHDGKIEKAVLSRKIGENTISIEIVADLRWRGTFSFKCIHNGKETPYRHDAMDPLTFLTSFKSELIKFFEKEAVVL